jgi:uncharacterized membrane protein YjdF
MLEKNNKYHNVGEKQLFIVFLQHYGIYCFSPTLWYLLCFSNIMVFIVLLQHYGIYCFSPTLWYLLFCSNIMVFIVLLQHCGIYCLCWRKTINTIMLEQNNKYHNVGAKQ